MKARVKVGDLSTSRSYLPQDYGADVTRVRRILFEVERAAAISDGVTIFGGHATSLAVCIHQRKGVGGRGLTKAMLSVRDNMAITLAAGHFKYPAARVTRARHELGWSETRFWARVDWLLDQGVAEVERPVQVRRLRRLRDLRRAARSAC